MNVAMFRDDSAAESYRSLRSRGVAASHFLQAFCDSDDSDDSAVSIQASSMGMPRLVAMFEAVVPCA